MRDAYLSGSPGFFSPAQPANRRSSVRFVFGMLMTGELDRSPFAEIPHPTRLYYRTTPWFLPLAALAFRTLDRFGR